MADPAKFKSVSVSIATYKILKYLGDGKITDADLTVSKTIESLAKKEGKETWIQKRKSKLKKFARSVEEMVLLESHTTKQVRNNGLIVMSVITKERL